MTRKGDTPAYIHQMKKEPLARPGASNNPTIKTRYQGNLPAIHRWPYECRSQGSGNLQESWKLSYSRRCSEASAAEAFKRCGISPDPGMETGYVMRDASRMAVGVEWDALDLALSIMVTFKEGLGETNTEA